MGRPVRLNHRAGPLPAGSRGPAPPHRLERRPCFHYIHSMPSKPLELPPTVARRFVEDMLAWFAERNSIKRDEYRRTPAPRAQAALLGQAEAHRRDPDVFGNEGSDTTEVRPIPATNVIPFTHTFSAVPALEPKARAPCVPFHARPRSSIPPEDQPLAPRRLAAPVF